VKRPDVSRHRSPTHQVVVALSDQSVERREIEAPLSQAPLKCAQPPLECDVLEPVECTLWSSAWTKDRDVVSHFHQRVRQTVGGPSNADLALRRQVEGGDRKAETLVGVRVEVRGVGAPCAMTIGDHRRMTSSVPPCSTISGLTHPAPTAVNERLLERASAEAG